MTTDSTSKDLLDFVAGIVKGDFDDSLSMIRNAVAQREQVLSPTPVVGGRGRLKNCRPLYLNGAPFTIKKFNPKRIVVNIDPDWLAAHPRATRWHGDVTCPVGMLDFT